jgi:predicted nuclease with TOPRIM domain
MGRVFIIAAIAFVLCGFCDGVTTDPTAGGFLGGVCGNSTGAYRKRLEEKRSTLQELETTNDDLQRRLTRAQGEARSLGQRSQSLRTKVVAIGHRLSKIETIASKQRELDQLNTEIAALRKTWTVLMEHAEGRADTVDAIQRGREQAKQQKEATALADDESSARNIEDRLSQLERTSRVLRSR